LQDYFDEVGEKKIKGFVLKGGIKGWASKYSGEMMDWYSETFWAEQAK